jgi:hypothetical protein
LLIDDSETAAIINAQAVVLTYQYLLKLVQCRWVISRQPLAKVMRNPVCRRLPGGKVWLGDISSNLQIGIKS